MRSDEAVARDEARRKFPTTLMTPSCSSVSTDALGLSCPSKKASLSPEQAGTSRLEAVLGFSCYSDLI